MYTKRDESLNQPNAPDTERNAEETSERKRKQGQKWGGRSEMRNVGRERVKRERCTKAAVAGGCKGADGQPPEYSRRRRCFALAATPYRYRLGKTVLPECCKESNNTQVLRVQGNETSAKW